MPSLLPKRLYTLCALLCLMIGTGGGIELYAQQEGSNLSAASMPDGYEPNTFAYRFLDLPSTPQSLAMGGMLLTFVEDNPGLAFDNPALYGQESAGQLYLSYFNYMRGVNNMNALYGSGVGDRGTWGVGVRSMLYGTMQGADAQGLKTAPFSALDLSVQGLFSYDLTPQLRGGLALKAIYGHVERYNAFALVADAGLSYFSEPAGASFALALTNAGGTIKGYGTQRSLPAWDIRLGYSQTFRHAPFRIHFTAYGLSPDNLRSMGKGEKWGRRLLRHLAFGAEYRPMESFWVGLGFNPSVAFDLSAQGARSLNGLSAGVGFKHQYFSIALAAAMYTPQAAGVMFSISTNFGNDRYSF